MEEKGKRITEDEILKKLDRYKEKHKELSDFINDVRLKCGFASRLFGLAYLQTVGVGEEEHYPIHVEDLEVLERMFLDLNQRAWELPICYSIRSKNS